MANIKSQIKRIRTSERQRVANKGVRSELKTYLKKFDVAAEAGDAEAAEGVRRTAAQKLDKAASAGVIHKNTAANHKSSMAVRLTKIAGAPAEAETKKAPAKKAGTKTAAAKKAAAKATVKKATAARKTTSRKTTSK